MTGIDPERDRFYMRMALSMALRGTGNVSPNPMVGCVIVDPQGVTGWGYHSEPGGPHAEVKALAMAGERGKGATLYVNLEPCCHFGRTPPCVPRIIGSGVSRVVSGTADPDPRVSCRGFSILRSEGVEVEENVLMMECRALNRGFISRIERKRPWITLKAALTLDGNMALRSGESKWITNEFSRARAHMLRDSHDAVMVGSGTALQDDPAMTVRSVSGRNPVAVVLDPMLRIHEEARIIREGSIFFISPMAPAEKRLFLEKKGCRIYEIAMTDDHKQSLDQILEKLAQEGVNYLLVEGGSPWFLYQRKTFRRGLLFVSPVFAGSGKDLATDSLLSILRGRSASDSAPSGKWKAIYGLRGSTLVHRACRINGKNYFLQQERRGYGHEYR